LLASNLVEKVEIKSGKAFSPRSLIVFLAFVIFNGISYSFLSCCSNFSASSIEILKSTPSTSACTTVGFNSIYASFGSLYISSRIFCKSTGSGSLYSTGISIS
jgi:hypothetical protein